MPDGHGEHVGSAARSRRRHSHSHRHSNSPHSQLSSQSFLLFNAPESPDIRTQTLPPPSSPPPLLPRSTYSRPQESPAHRLSLLTEFLNQHHGVHDAVEESLGQSPDPREYYRQYSDLFQDLQNGPLGVGSIFPVEVETGMIAVAHPEVSAGRLSSVPSDASPGPRGSASRLYHESSSGLSGRHSADSSSRSRPVYSSRVSSSGQSSFKDLLQKFNESPTGPDSHRQSGTVSPTPNPHGQSRYWDRGDPLAVAKPEYRRQQSQDHSWSSTRKPSTHKSPPQDSTRPRSHWQDSPGSQCLAGPNESGSHTPLEENTTSPPFRRPLFGELLQIDTAVDHPGHGIQRRGSDSSVQSPNPALLGRPRFELGPGVSPSSPTAWYLGYTPSLEAINLEASNLHHRRTRSEFCAGTTPVVTSALSTHMAVASPTESAGSDAAHSKSRIPVASRRRSHASDSSHSSSSPRETSAPGLYPPHLSLPPKGTSRIPKPSNRSPKSSRPASSRLPLAVKSPASHEMTLDDCLTPHPEKDGHLKAYISAPPPKKSPPLRSSRPRLPVSIAATSTPRLKVEDRVSHFQVQNSTERDTRNARPRTRRLPELDNLDFAARRQKIKQAFNETLQKEEKAAERRRLAEFKKDEEVRAQLLREGKQRKKRSRAELSQDRDVMDSVYESVLGGDESDEIQALSRTSEGQAISAAPSLSIDTSGSIAEKDIRSGSEQPQEQSQPPPPSPSIDLGDSPTLGLSDQICTQSRFGPENGQTSDVTPSSAVTADTNESDTTHFDLEPPEMHFQETEMSHRTVLSQIMQMRESSSSSQASSEDHDCASCVSDEKESIQIMLAPSFFDDSVDSSDNQEQHEAGDEPDLSEGQLNRSSMTSWSSFVRDHLSPEVPLEQADEALSSTDQNHLLPMSSPESDKTSQPLSATVFPLPSMDDPLNRVLYEKPVPETGDRPSHLIFPNLARQGGWDSRRVTQLYLEELTRGRFHRPPSTGKILERPSAPPQLDREVETPPRTDSLTDDPVLVPLSEDLPSLDSLCHRPSLSLRDDWVTASPSVGDWMQVAADEAPTPPPKDETEGLGLEDVSTPRLVTRGFELDGSRQGLGLAVQVFSPEDDDEEGVAGDGQQQRRQEQHQQQHLDTSAPPLPDYAPPPPPPTTTQMGDVVEPLLSPSIYSRHPPSSIIPSDAFGASNDYLPAKSSEESSLSQVGLTPSPPTLLSSATSQQPPSVDQSRIEINKGSPSPEQRRLKKRRNVIKELVDTEYTYGRDLKVVEDIYKGTSSSCLDLSADDVKTLFGNSDQVVQFSMTFQDGLKKAAKSVYVMPKSQRWSSKRGSRATQGSTLVDDQSPEADPETSDSDKDSRTFIGQAFVEKMAQMEKVYTDYLKNHDVANKKLVTLQRNPKVAIWLKECREWASDLTQAWNLDSLLVKPVQRILKYPLLLNELLQATPVDHPDYAAIANAHEGVTNISVRINELKKRADVVGQVVSSRKRKESDVRAGLSKALGRRTEKLKQHVGLSEIFEDKEYDVLSQRFGDSFCQLQVVMRDVEMYVREVHSEMDHFHDCITAIEGCIDVAQSHYTEIESKWRRFRMSVREVMTVALPEHVAAVRKDVIEPMVTLLKLHDGPQKVMQKRNKRLIDYARFKSIKDRNDKPDKKTVEQGEQFVALNDALKDELPKLFSLTAKLMEACLNNFVKIQMAWLRILRTKLGSLFDRLPEEISGIISDWAADFSFSEAQVLSLGICNGSILAESINLVNFNTPSTGPEVASPRRPSTVNSSSNHTASFNAEASPKASQDFSNGSIVVQSPPVDTLSQHHHAANGRGRTDSSHSTTMRPPGTPEMFNSIQPSIQNGGNGSTERVVPVRPNTGTTHSIDTFPALPRLSLDMPFMNDPLMNEGDQNGAFDLAETTTSPGGRFSNFFSSAMPMSDSPLQELPPDARPPKDPKVIFLAASLFEFNIDRARREAGYPYLTYVTGEIFDVIGEKGELWLARNQDDPNHQVGWIWTKHFAKVGA
ncbi:hypothetical protein V8E54_011589 [Elaphomyces granulatus]